MLLDIKRHTVSHLNSLNSGLKASTGLDVAALLHCITSLWKVHISLHKQAKQWFHMTVAVCHWDKMKSQKLFQSCWFCNLKDRKIKTGKSNVHYSITMPCGYFHTIYRVLKERTPKKVALKIIRAFNKDLIVLMIDLYTCRNWYNQWLLP